METFSSLIQAAIAVCVPVVAIFVIAYFKAISSNANARTTSIVSKQCMDELSGAVWAAVAKTNQVTVDELKEAGEFPRSAQTNAFREAKQAVIKALAPTTTRFLQDMYGNYDSLLEAKIEEAVRAQKQNILAPTVWVGEDDVID